MPKFRAIWSIDATGHSDEFEARDAAHAKQLVDDDEAGEWDRGEVETADPIELLDIVEVSK